MSIIFLNKQESGAASKLLEHLNRKFVENGFRNFSITDVAGHLNISKKTIYKTYRTKEEIIRIILIRQLSTIYSDVIQIVQAHSNIVEKLNDLSIIVEEYFTIFNEHSIKRLNQYFPELADYIIQFRAQRIIPLIHTLLNIGKKKHLIEDIPNEIVIKVFTSSLSEIVESKSGHISADSFHTTFREAFGMLMNGLLTKKGKQFFNNTTEVKNENN